MRTISLDPQLGNPSEEVLEQYATCFVDGELHLENEMVTHDTYLIHKDNIDDYLVDVLDAENIKIELLKQLL